MPQIFFLQGTRTTDRLKFYVFPTDFIYLFSPTVIPFDVITLKNGHRAERRDSVAGGTLWGQGDQQRKHSALDT